ncbi:MAG: flagellar protein FlaG [Candidatus Kapaibacterium sp.]
MIKSIGNSESVSSSFDNLLSNLANKNTPTEVSQTTTRVGKQNNDEFQKTIDTQKIESEISKLLEDDSLISQFTTDKETEKLILKILNKDTKEVVRQYPPEVSLKIARMVSNMIESNSIADVRI